MTFVTCILIGFDRLFVDCLYVWVCCFLCDFLVDLIVIRLCNPCICEACIRLYFLDCRILGLFALVVLMPSRSCCRCLLGFVECFYVFWLFFYV